MRKEMEEQLIAAAKEARGNAYVPYSHYSVGAALLTEDGRIIKGCNVENASYPAGLCAERTAIFSAVAAGCRNFAAIAVCGGEEGKIPATYAIPCGMCLQVMSEFCAPDFPILLVRGQNEVERHQLKDFLPYVFDGVK